MATPGESKGPSTAVIVVCVVLLLAGLGSAAFLVVTATQRANLSRHRSSDMSNLSQIGKALVMYSNVSANQGRYPPSLDLLYPDYIKDERVFLSPLVPDGEHLPGPGTLKRCDYFYVPGAKSDDGVAFVAFGPSAQGGRNVLVAAGSVEFYEGSNELFIQAYKNKGISLEFDVDLSATDRSRLRALRRELGLDKDAKSETPEK
ncbi:MAG: hypothetical protein L6R28_08245 [Planctomycetes bacterium]|nr:hypothetical protein [Planctomycetota bacterium]